MDKLIEEFNYYRKVCRQLYNGTSTICFIRIYIYRLSYPKSLQYFVERINDAK
jgi:hypothetical protein